MKRIIIIVEGQTESTFVSEVLAPYIYQRLEYDCMVTPILIHLGMSGGRGGFVNYEHLRNDVLHALQSQDQDLIVTTFVDYFRIPQTSMPGHEDWKDEADHYLQVKKMEDAMSLDISDRRFIPYIQMHEFEALLYSSMDGFDKFWKEDFAKKVHSIKDNFKNPEDINTNPEGAPSKRLLAINPSYDKVVEGNIIALEVGIDKMLEACPRFKKWVELIIGKC